ncbi:A24 family peptidase [Telmatospirillum sp. J64-1]|uniref:prepilin peptidase n=1 Tax=Telmatospirillum sp. J64-1 TaxID=2502183 RepID=UPI00163DD643|nr:A24 family peptidase [Telmatospirillum sp. J64-1]
MMVLGAGEIAAAAAFGLLGGSFVSAWSYRLPRGQSIAAGRSACPACGHELGALDLVPLFSWLVNRGRCRHCKAPVSLRYPLIETVTAAAVVLAALAAAGPVEAVLLGLVVTLLVALAVVDIEFGLLPDMLHLALLPPALAWRWLLDGTPWWGLAGAAGGLAFGLALHHGFRLVTGRDGLGLGDVKFLGVAGLLLLPWQWGIFPLLAGLFGIATGLAWRALGRGAEFPFGPALIAALALCLLWPEAVSWARL